MRSTWHRIAPVLAACLLLAGCGDGEGTAAYPVPDLPPVPREEKARFALDRLLHGPLPRTAAFAIPQLHAQNLEHARSDLAALKAETLALLADPALQEALTRPGADRNPWHNVLEVLAGLETPPAGLLVAWCEPALEVSDLPLDRRAVRVLERAPHADAASALLLRFLERRPRDREVAPLALRLLAARGSPWRERALATAFRGGSRVLWERTATDLAAAEDGDDALAWFALLADTSGPVEVRGTGRTVDAAWYFARALLDEAVWPREVLALDAAGRAGRIVAPASALDAGGFLPEPPDASPVYAWRQALVTGRPAAANARCALALAGHAAFRQAVLDDLSSYDAMLEALARACPVTADAAEDLENARIVAELFLDDLRSGRRPDTTEVLGALATIAEAQPAEGVSALEQVLRTARPAVAYQKVIEGAHDLLRTLDADRLRSVARELALSEDAQEREVGLLLVRRGRDPRHAALLDELLAGAAPAERAALRRLAVWVWTAPSGHDDQARAAFAERYARWVDESDDAQAQVLAPGLLDLGAPGAAAYAQGLLGPRRPVYVQGLLRRSRLVRVEVVEALLRPVDATTSPGDRHAAWIAVYRLAPPAAAPFVAAARMRLAPPDRVEVDDVLAVVRHRAER